MAPKNTTMDGAFRRLADIETRLPIGGELVIDGRRTPYRNTAPIGVLSQAVGAWVEGRALQGRLADAFVRGELPADAPPIDHIAQAIARRAAYGPPIPPELVDTGLPPDVDQDENEDGDAGAPESGSQPL